MPGVPASGRGSRNPEAVSDASLPPFQACVSSMDSLEWSPPMSEPIDFAKGGRLVPVVVQTTAPAPS